MKYTIVYFAFRFVVITYEPLKLT